MERREGSSPSFEPEGKSLEECEGVERYSVQEGTLGRPCFNSVQSFDISLDAC